MTNNFTKATILIPKTNFYHLRAALFHATPVLQRKRRNNWDSYNPRSNSYSSRKSRRPNLKQSLLRNARSYADYVFQSWKDGFDEDDPFGSRTASWFKQNHSKGSRRDQTSNQGSKHQHKRTFQFFEDEDDIEVETLFRSAFGGNQFFTWTFIDDEIPRGRCSFSYSNSNKYRKNSRYQHEEYYEFSSDSDSDSSESDLASDRLALGLSASGPLKLEDVKTAYRSCALKWHPDRHDDSSKVIAEEKFKLCSAAYHSLCDKLAAVSGSVRNVNFCQWCGGATKHGIPDGEEKMRPICTLCGRVTYQNPKMVVGCLIEHDNKILLCKRNIQPSHGLWTLPAGYLEIGESAAERAIRETWEEAEAEVEVVSPFTQLGIPLIGQTYIIFLAKLKNPHFAPGPESSECRLFPLEDIPFDSLAFSSVLVTLKLYIEDVKNGKLKFHYGTVNKRPGTSPSDIRAYTLDYHLQS